MDEPKEIHEQSKNAFSRPRSFDKTLLPIIIPRIRTIAFLPPAFIILPLSIERIESGRRKPCNDLDDTSSRFSFLSFPFFEEKFISLEKIFKEIRIEISKKEGVMHRLPLSFALLTYCGYWRPTKWPTSSLKYHLYNVYSIFMILLLYSFSVCVCIDSLISKNLETITDKFSLSISILGVSLKVTNLFLQRGQIINVMNILLKENCIPRDKEENIIQQRSDNYARKLTIYCEILNKSTAFFATVLQYKLIRTRTLPVFNWMPYDFSSQKLYIISLLYQTICLLICANTSVGHETLISGLLIQIGAQFEIFCHRARNLSSSIVAAGNCSVSREDSKIRCRRIIRNLVRHHIEVYKFAETVNIVFQYMILLQFSISSLVLCLSMYKISIINPLSMNFLWSGFYLCCMLIQVYLYCWFGNEVTLKSDKVSDAVYEIDWTEFPTDVMKDLLMIIIRCRRPVRMTSGHIVVLSTQSFMTIMKMTYSLYNLLTNSTTK